jgi:uncharacterized membrane protein YebE (DUF533 family)
MAQRATAQQGRMTRQAERSDDHVNANKLLEQFLGADAGKLMQKAGSTVQQRGKEAGLGGFAGGAVTGGILGLLIGNKKARKMGGNLAVYGGAAAAAALAWKAYQNWQQGQNANTAPVATPADTLSVDPRFLPGTTAAANGQPFQLVLILAMIGAAKADGHIDAQEQKALFEQVEKMGLDGEGKAFVFDALNKPVNIGDIAAAASGIEQASELYLVSRLAIDPDHPAERAYLDALGHRLNLPAELIQHLEHQVEGSSGA